MQVTENTSTAMLSKLEEGWNCTILEDVDSHHPLMYWSTKFQSNSMYTGLLDSNYSICYSHQPNFSWCYAMRSLQIDAGVNQQKKKKSQISLPLHTWAKTTFIINWPTTRGETQPMNKPYNIKSRIGQKQNQSPSMGSVMESSSAATTSFAEDQHKHKNKNRTAALDENIFDFEVYGRIQFLETRKIFKSQAHINKTYSTKHLQTNE